MESLIFAIGRTIEGALFERDPTATWVTSSNQAQWHYESAIIGSFIMKWNYYWIHTIDLICGDIRDVIKLNIKLTLSSDICRHGHMMMAGFNIIN